MAVSSQSSSRGSKRPKPKAYCLSQLEGEARENALGHLEERLRFCDGLETQALTEYFAEILAERGLPNDDIEWDIGSGRGDFVAFYGHGDINKFLAYAQDGAFIPIIDNYDPGDRWYLEIHRSHSRGRGMAPSLNIPAYDPLESIAQWFQEVLWDVVEDTASELRKIGRDWIDDEFSVESLTDFAEANDYRFDKDGNIL